MKLGDLSAQYESGGDPGSISNGDGDAGGKSYGLYQLSLNAGSLQAFLDWCATNADQVHQVLSLYQVASDNFDVVWGKLATDYTDDFVNAQWGYIKSAYYDPAVTALQGINVDVTTRSEALQQVLWSRAVQYSPGNMADLFAEAAQYASKAITDMTDADFIQNVYEVNLDDGQWTSGSPSLRPGLFARFLDERQKALAMLG